MESKVTLIQTGQTSIGIELGSTRIKAVLIDNIGNLLASGEYHWENQFIQGIWTYAQQDIWHGIQQAYQALQTSVKKQYDVVISQVKSIGISGMMHGYLPFDKFGKQLAPFRTWRNNITQNSAQYLTALFQYTIPQRWSIAHLYQAILNNEPHLKDLDYITTLAGYIHWQLTGERVVGIGEASGMFPLDFQRKNYDLNCLNSFNELIKPFHYPWKIEHLLPKVLLAGQCAGRLTETGAKLLDVSGNLQAGATMCPPEGDAGTGMVATNTIKSQTGNISAGTSAFAMLVLPQGLSQNYENIDIVATPAGKLVAMAHANNCTSAINAWVNIFSELLTVFKVEYNANQLYNRLFQQTEFADKNAGNLLAYGFYSGEHCLGINEGCPMFIHPTNSQFNLANFILAQLYSAFATLKLNLDSLIKQEKIAIQQILAHGGIFKTQNVAAKVLASALEIPVVTMENANQGGAWGIALLANYLEYASKFSLEQYLDRMFASANHIKHLPDAEMIKGYQQFIKHYQRDLILVKQTTTLYSEK